REMVGEITDTVAGFSSDLTIDGSRGVRGYALRCRWQHASSGGRVVCGVGSDHVATSFTGRGSDPRVSVPGFRPLGFDPRVSIKVPVAPRPLCRGTPRRQTEAQ